MQQVLHSLSDGVLACSFWTSVYRVWLKHVAEICFKVYQLRNGSRVAKKKTSYKRDDNNPTFNEAMIFSLPQHMLEARNGSCHKQIEMEVTAKYLGIND